MKRTSTGITALIWMVGVLGWTFNAVVFTHPVSVGLAIVSIVAAIAYSIRYLAMKSEPEHDSSPSMRPCEDSTQDEKCDREGGYKVAMVVYGASRQFEVQRLEPGDSATSYCSGHATIAAENPVRETPIE